MQKRADLRDDQRLPAIPPVAAPPDDIGFISVAADEARRQRAELYKRIIAAVGALLLVLLVWRLFI